MMTRPDAFDALRRYAHQLRAEAPPRPALRPAPSTAQGRTSLRVLALAASLFALAFAGLAAAADDAVPGDLLYPFDLAGEWVADLTPWGSDRDAERIDEAVVLVDRGEIDRALVALERVAERVAADRADVSDLLAAIQEMQAIPQSDTGRGEEVRLIARTLGSKVSAGRVEGDTPGQGSIPDTPGQGSPPSTPGQGSPPSTPGQGSPPSTPGQGSPPSTPGQGSPPSTPGQGGGAGRP